MSLMASWAKQSNLSCLISSNQWHKVCRCLCSNSTQCTTYFSICILFPKLQTKIGGFDKDNLIVAMTELFCEGSEYSAALDRRAVAYDPAKYVCKSSEKLIAFYQMILPPCRNNSFLRYCTVFILL